MSEYEKGDPCPNLFCDGKLTLKHETYTIKREETMKRTLSVKTISFPVCPLCLWEDKAEILNYI